MSKPTWQDLHNATSAELKKTYKLTDRQLEKSVRDHAYGANTDQRRAFYETVYSSKSKR